MFRRGGIGNASKKKCVIADLVFAKALSPFDWECNAKSPVIFLAQIVGVASSFERSVSTTAFTEVIFLGETNTLYGRNF